VGLFSCIILTKWHGQKTWHHYFGTMLLLADSSRRFPGGAPKGETLRAMRCLASQVHPPKIFHFTEIRI
jgi:hypothetical protein